MKHFIISEEQLNDLAGTHDPQKIVATLQSMPELKRLSDDEIGQVGLSFSLPYSTISFVNAIMDKLGVPK